MTARPSDEEILAEARRAEPTRRDELLGRLYDRHYPRIFRWALHATDTPDEAADLAQEIVLRVHRRIDSFRGDSRFSTWLYTVVRSVTINRGIARRREKERIDLADDLSNVDTDDIELTQQLISQEDAARVREIIQQELRPDEAQVVYLHCVDGITLPAITKLLGLTNRSGAKAPYVSGMRKLRKRFAREDGGDRQP